MQFVAGIQWEWKLIKFVSVAEQFQWKYIRILMSGFHHFTVFFAHVFVIHQLDLSMLV